MACVGGGSNAMGIFSAFIDDREVRLVGVEAAGDGLATGKHGATLALGRPGVLHGSRSYVLQDEDGQIVEAHSISAGLDYPGVGPEHSYLKDHGRLELRQATDDEALEAFGYLARTEGIIPALERPTRWRRRASWRASWGRRGSSSSTSRGGRQGRGPRAQGAAPSEPPAEARRGEAARRRRAPEAPVKRKGGPVSPAPDRIQAAFAGRRGARRRRSWSPT